MKSLLSLSCFLVLILSCARKEQITYPKPKDNKPAAALQKRSALVRSGTETPMALIGPGKYIPLYGSDSAEVTVKSFMMDVTPVTNEQFLAFVKSNPQWRRSVILKIFGDGNYLRTWENDTVPGKDQLPDAPVTNVSWYAAKAYCDCHGKRLPTIDEWEYVAMADATQPDARKSESYTKYILTWYEKRDTYKNEIGKTTKNYWGVYDLHGLVWEWTSDFNAVLMVNDNGKSISDDKNLFCGRASLSATDLRNYAAFMRYAFRESLKANYSVQNLGFRCAKDIPQNDSL